MKQRLFLLFCLGHILQISYAQDHTRDQDEQIRFEWPLIVNYPKTDYGADIQNWSITQDSSGIMYFANNEGLLSFDGSRWELFPHPDNLIIRAVAEGPGNRIYAGTYEDFGYWEKDPGGAMQYHSLKPLLQDFDFNNQEIWKIIVDGDDVWFQSFPVVFLLREGEITAHQAGGIMTAFEKTEGGLYTVIAGRGLFRLDGEDFSPVDQSAFFRNEMIRVILPFSPEKLLIASSDRGVYTYSEGEGLQPWNENAAGQMIDRVINRGLVTRDGKYIFGTQLYGIDVFDSAGNFLYNMNQETGLQNNTVLGLYSDRQGYLWAGLDNGIDFIDLQSGISFFRDTRGKIGAVYTAIIHGDILYAGTNKGLFYSPLIRNPGSGIVPLDFTMIPGSESQVWSLERFEDQLFCGHNNGTFEVRGTSLEKVSDISGGYSMRRLRGGTEEILVQASYTDLVLYKKNINRWEFSHVITGLNQPVRTIEPDHLGNIWAGHNTRGLFRIRLDDSLRVIESCRYYGRENGFISDFQIGVFRVNNRVVFLNEGKFFAFDDLDDSIVPYDLLNRDLQDNRYHRIIPSSGSEYWFISDSHLSLIRSDHDRIERIVEYPFELFGNRQIRNYEFTREVKPDRSLLCLDNGFVLLPHHNNRDSTGPVSPLFRRIRAYGKDRGIDLTLQNKKGFPAHELKNRYNSMLFQFACPSYGNSWEYLVKMEGLEEDWKTVPVPEIRYERLPAGDYLFRLKASDAWGNETAELNATVKIFAPWYWSAISKVLYLVLFMLLLFLIIRYFQKRLVIQEKNLRARQEAELVRIRNEQLRSEISHKSKELANTTFNIMKKNELLIEIREALEKEARSAVPEQKRAFSRLARLVDRNISHEDDWKVFESHFERAHEEFLNRIREQYPGLTPGDLKLCAYLRMNLSTKKIALLLGISERGVENHRYRLRKKLNLDHGTNLLELMMNF